MSGSAAPAFRTAAVTSKDGTTIGYRQVGAGPGLVLVHGGLMSAQNFERLAAALAGDFSVYVPDRRGRGMSGPVRPGHGAATEVDDLRALLDETGAGNVFGLSAGAVIALEAARTLPQIGRLALYEPPLSLDGIRPVAWLPRYERELDGGDRAAALATVMKGTGDSAALRLVPRWLLIPLLRRVLPRLDEQAHRHGQVSLGDLVPTMRYDARTILDTAGPLDRFAAVRCPVLLLGGARSAGSLRAVLGGLAAVLPDARRTTLPGVGHVAADNAGKPDLVAAELRAFFR